MSNQSFQATQNGNEVLRSYQHATKLYIDNNYLKSPKLGFLYYVSFNINSNNIIDQGWGFKNSNEVGLLVKKIDLPKFKINTETLNQYNRKTVVQTKLNYDPVSIEFHDDNQDITNNLWINYYRYYFKDSNYGGNSVGESERNQQVPEFKDTKFKETDYTYGMYGYNDNNEPFFSTIDIYVLRQGFFTQMTLVNPKITDWSHDSLDQAEGAKILRNRMSVIYENVFYNQGQISENSPEGFTTLYYDKYPSPNTFIKDTTSNTDFGNPVIKTNNPNVSNKKDVIVKTGYDINQSPLGKLADAGLGKYAPIPTKQNQSGSLGVNVFKGQNTSVNGIIKVALASVTQSRNTGTA